MDGTSQLPLKLENDREIGKSVPLEKFYYGSLQELVVFERNEGYALSSTRKTRK